MDDNTTTGHLDPAAALYMLLSITKRCNMRCPNCFFIRQDSDFFAPEDIAFNDLINIVEHYRARGIRQIIPYAEGEALLHPQYEDIVTYILKTLNVKPWLVTNGAYLADHARFVAGNLCEVLVSIDSPDAAGHAEYRGAATGRLYDAAIRGIEALISLKGELQSSLAVVINCVVTAERCHEIPEMIRLAEELGVSSIRFSNFHLTGGAGSATPLHIDNQKALAVIREVIRRRDYKINIHLPNLLGKAKPPFSCRMLATIFIGVNGDFSPCCRIASAGKWGNYFTDPDKHDNHDLRQFRRTLKTARDITALPEICRNCGYLCQLRPAFSAKTRQWSLSSSF
jgi:MoaA/NifB/PqqE/SkfB family radical SAM enzyme